MVTALLGTVLERDGSVYRVATSDGEIRAVLTGKAKVSGPLNVSLRLLTKRTAKAKFLATRKTRLIRANRAGSYRFKFDVSALSAYAYRVRESAGMQSRVVPASSCAPGYQVPEAPLALLLPLSLLLGLGLLAFRRRRVAPSL